MKNPVAKNLVWIVVALVIVLLAMIAWSIPSFVAESPLPETPVTEETPPEEGWVCQMDAMICPDGSSVGRSGPNCEFTPCPATDATSAMLTTFLGGSATGLTVTVNPREVVSDSRCPIGVQCVWAGEVQVRTAISTPTGHGEHVLKIGEPQPFGDYTVTLTGVTPAPSAGETIPESSYRFTFEVKK